MERLAARALAALARHHAPSARHSARVARLVALIDPDLYYPALAHDSGKTYIARGILGKPGPLTVIQRVEYIGRHPNWGLDMLHEQADAVGLEVPAVYDAVCFSHHERWDGKGYPEGLAGDEIPWCARLLAVCDVYEALTSAERSYRAPVSWQEALDEIERGAGTQFDPAAVQLLIDVVLALPAGYLRDGTLPRRVRLRIQTRAVVLRWLHAA